MRSPRELLALVLLVSCLCGSLAAEGGDPLLLSEEQVERLVARCTDPSLSAALDALQGTFGEDVSH